MAYVDILTFSLSIAHLNMSICSSVYVPLSHNPPVAKEEEKQRQVQWARDLRQEREQLETRVKQLNISITVRVAEVLG